MSTFILLVLHIFTLLSTSATGKENNAAIGKRHVFTVAQEGFYMDGKKLNIYAGEIHYFRIAACEWEDRLRKLQKAGLNTVSTAVEWAMHQPTPENYNWDGDANFTRFVELAQNLNLFVIVRAGPYIGVDRDLGGVPGWILTTNELKNNPWVGRSNPVYQKYAESWLSHFLPQLSNMMITNGGPVLMVQIDSDLGEAEPCMTTDWLYHSFTSHLGDAAVLFTMDDNKDHNLKCGKIRNTIPLFRTNPWEYMTSFNQSVTQLFSAVEKVCQGSAKLIEIRTGVAWNWKGERYTFETEDIIKTLSDLIDYDASIIIYMFAGGTNFERAGKSERNTAGLTTSYDFDAIISESGHLTEKFDKLKSILPSQLNFYDDMSEESDNNDSYDISGNLTLITLGSLTSTNFRFEFGLRGQESRYPLTFAELGVTNGLVLYQTTMPEEFKSREAASLLVCKGINDRGYVYVNEKFTGILDNMKDTVLKIPIIPRGTIQIIVENTGYLAQSVIGEPKGITANITLNQKVLTKWLMYTLPLDNVDRLQEAARNMKQRRAIEEGNSFLLATFKVPSNISLATVRTYLNLKRFTKGLVFLNDRSLGKYWTAGPQNELYLPGCYLRPPPMENQLLIIELRRYQMHYVERDKAVGSGGVKKTNNGSGSSRYGGDKLIFHFILVYVCRLIRLGYASLN